MVDDKYRVPYLSAFPGLVENVLPHLKHNVLRKTKTSAHVAHPILGVYQTRGFAMDSINIVVGASGLTQDKPDW